MRQVFYILSLIIMVAFMFSNVEADSEMAYIPEGEFLMGSLEEKGKSNEHPQHKVYLDAFYIDRYEVTFKDFEEYLDTNPKQHPTITGWYDRKARPDMLNKPVFGLQWKRCKKYCEWKHKRLPTEAEWERTAKGIENRSYPWGNEPPDKYRANYGNCCFIQKGMVLSQVGDFDQGKTPELVFDLGGNVAEWVYDWYDKKYYAVSPYKNPKGPEKGKYHVIRGGAWNSLPVYLRSSSRYGDSDAKDYYGIGCRCAKSAD
ncbi:MAG: formylglycine-generating enzyme family protein [Nitrospina sp.]|jgi:formylglycine-generating enzyme required for sulfatase activity|nr:formylglycine-generating enzyme family protein [Nitrospina sp.]MBT5632895.1 formylglycine-generating enzyme family protein [Nitrospina sp.]